METAVKNNPLGVDPIGKLVVKFALPSTIALVVNALYNIIDQIFIGQGIGYLGNGATNVIFPLVVLTIAIGSMFGDGCTSYMSLQLGKGDKESASRSVCNTFLVMMVVSIIFMILIMIFLEPVARLLGATDNILPYAKEYGFIIAIGFPFSMIDLALSAIIRADGHPTFVMIGLLVGCGTNMILDPVFIFGCNMGMTGAALATIIGEILNAVMLLCYLPKLHTVDLKKAYFRVRFSIMKRVIVQGFSSFILQLSIVIVIAVSNNLLVAYGASSKYGSDIPIAAMGITMKIGGIVINIVQGIATGTLPIIGYNYGAGQFSRVKQTFRIAVITATVISCIAFVIFQITPMSIISIFGSESEVYNEFAVKCLTIYLFCIPINAFQMCAGIFFQAVGRPGLSAVNAMLRQVVFLVPAMIILCAVVGVEGAIWAGPVADGMAFAAAVLLTVCFWKKIFFMEKNG